MKSFSFISSLSLFFLTSFAFAEGPQCLNKMGDENNQEVIKSLNEAKDPLTLAFNNLASATSGICTTCARTGDQENLAKAINQIQNVIEPKKIKKECIAASMQREVAQDSTTCRGSKPTHVSKESDRVPCVDDKVLSFIHYAVNEGIRCMSQGRDPIDPRYILQKLNNETGFSFFFAYSGGVGIGQLTSDPVKELTGWKRNGKEIEGNASYILEELMQNNSPACAPFKEIIKNEMEKPPGSPGSPRNYCTWVKPGDGIGRNLVYSLGYFIYVRDKVMKPLLKEKAPNLANNQEVLNALTLAGYGPDGPFGAKANLGSRRVMNPNTKAADVLKRIQKENSYVKQTGEKMIELARILKTGDANSKYQPTDAEKKGNTCVD